MQNRMLHQQNPNHEPTGAGELGSAPAGYTLRERLYAGPLSVAYRAVRDRDGLDVVIKQYRSSVQPLIDIEHEFRVLELLSGPGVPEAVEYDTGARRPTLITTFASGISLRRFVQQELPPVEVALAAMLELAKTLERLHSLRHIHLDIAPDNILIDPGSLSVSLIDFGHARTIGSAENARIPISGNAPGSLHFISPEQTGRMNRGCDFRSDLYGLGATLYFSLTGHPPFEGDDEMALIHAHIARDPKSPQTHRAQLPNVVCELVLKLLEKEPEDRYQRAQSLAADLVRLLDHFEASGTWPVHFPLGQDEIQLRTTRTGELFGRADSLRAVERAFDEAASGRLRIVTLQGEAGSGKSSLAHAIRREVANRRGRIFEIKLERNTDRAYSAWRGIAQSIVHQLLRESDSSLSQWKKTLERELGSLFGVFAELAPDAVHISSGIAPPPPVGPKETRARLSLTVRRLIHCLARPEHPAVVLIDDMQWSDAGSRALLRDLISSPTEAIARDPLALEHEHPALLIVLSYRPEPEWLEAWAKLAAARDPDYAQITHIELGPLPLEDSCALLAHLLDKPISGIRPLAELIERKTANNPLQIRHFLEYAQSHRWLYFVSGEGFCWDADALARAEAPEGAVGFLASRVSQLTPEQQRLLGWASIADGEFDAELLGTLMDVPPTDVTEVLFDLCELGLIRPSNSGFRFAHDRIREATEATLDPERRCKAHYAVAEALLSRTPDADRQRLAPAISEHLQHGLRAVPPERRVDAIGVCLAAGRQTLAAGAPDSAELHLRTARALFEEVERGEAPALWIDLQLESAECAFQRGRYLEADATLDALDPCIEGAIDRVRSQVKRIQVRALIAPPTELVDFVLRLLRDMGIRWPMYPSRLRAIWCLRRIVVRMRGRPIQELFQSAANIEFRHVAPLLLLRQSSTHFARVDCHLSAIAVGFSMQAQMNHGGVGAQAYSCGIFALYDYILLHNRERALRTASQALKWKDGVNAATRPALSIMVQALLYPFLMERRKALAPLHELAHDALVVGNVEWFLYAEFLFTVLGVLGGEPIPRSIDRLNDLAARVDQGGERLPGVQTCAKILELLLREEVMERMDGAAADLELEISRDSNSSAFFRCLFCLVCVLFERDDLVVEQADRIGDGLTRLSPWVHTIDFRFYVGIASARLALVSRGSERRRRLRTLRHCIRVLERHARDGPDFVHMLEILHAERARARGRHARAETLYRSATDRAVRRGFMHHAALAYERAAELHAARLEPANGDALLRRSIELYRAWGATEKTRLLELRLQHN